MNGCFFLLLCRRQDMKVNMSQAKNGQGLCYTTDKAQLLALSFEISGPSERQPAKIIKLHVQYNRRKFFQGGLKSPIFLRNASHNISLGDISQSK